MKYQVQIQYTNPSHEHVSLRRRVETITRLVEAANEAEAINRAANQQRSLGFLIKEAAVMNSPKEENLHADEKEKKKKKVVGDDNEQTDIAASGGVKEAAGGTESYSLLKKGEKLKPMKLKEGFDPEPSDIAAHLVKKHGKGKVTKDHVDAYERDRDSNKGIDKEAVMKHVQKMSEEVEQIDELKKSTLASYVKKATRDVASASRLQRGYETDAARSEFPPVQRGSELAAKDMRKFAGKRSRGIAKAVDKLAKEEIELDEAQKKLKPSYWKAEWRLGTQSDVDKNNKKIFDRLAKTDPVKASAFHDNLMRMRKKDVKEEVEQVDEANMRFDYEAAARPKSSDVKNFLNRDKNARAAAASKKYIRRMTKLGGLGPNQTKKDTEAHMKAHFEEVVAEASKEGKDVMRNMRASLKSMDLRHGVDSDKREAGYKMSPAVKAAQAKSDELSKVVKRPQAGTLAAVHKSMEREMLKKEAVENNGKQKARKAAEKMVNKAKGKANKINLTPELEPGKPND